MTWEAATIPEGVSDDDVRAYCLKVAIGIQGPGEHARRLAEELFRRMKEATERARS